MSAYKRHKIRIKKKLDFQAKSHSLEVLQKSFGFAMLVLGAFLVSSSSLFFLITSESRQATQELEQFSQEVECELPSAPTQLSAGSGPEVGEVTLSWQAAARARRYSLEYGTQWMSFNHVLDDIGNVSTYVVSGMDPKQANFFVIYAHNECGRSTIALNTEGVAGVAAYPGSKPVPKQSATEPSTPREPAPSPVALVPSTDVTETRSTPPPLTQEEFEAQIKSQPKDAELTGAVVSTPQPTPKMTSPQITQREVSSAPVEVSKLRQSPLVVLLPMLGLGVVFLIVGFLLVKYKQKSADLEYAMKQG
jgi:hypothetical protein